MTIKKINDTASSGQVAGGTEGVTIADRFRLDLPDANAKPAGGKVSTVTVAAAFIALAVVGMLAYTLWKHWEFLMPA